MTKEKLIKLDEIWVWHDDVVVTWRNMNSDDEAAIASLYEWYIILCYTTSFVFFIWILKLTIEYNFIFFYWQPYRVYNNIVLCIYVTWYRWTGLKIKICIDNRFKIFDPSCMFPTKIFIFLYRLPMLLDWLLYCLLIRSLWRLLENDFFAFWNFILKPRQKYYIINVEHSEFINIITI